MTLLGKKTPKCKYLVILRARSGTLAPNKGKRKLYWTSAGLAFHLCDFSHLQQCGGAHMLTCTSGTSSLLSLPSLLPEPSLTSPVDALHPPPCFSPVQATWDAVTKLLAGWSFRNQEGAKGGSNALYPPLLLLFPKRIRLLNSTVPLENQEGGICAMSEINILFWVQACQ